MSDMTYRPKFLVLLGLVLLVPLFLWNFRRAVPRDADLVHAHWLAAGAVAATLRTPFVVQVWGTDLELARRVPCCLLYTSDAADE